MKKINYFFSEKDTQKIKDYFNQEINDINLSFKNNKIDNRYSYSFNVENYQDKYDDRFLKITFYIKETIVNKTIENIFYHHVIDDFQGIKTLDISDFGNDKSILVRLNLAYECYESKANDLDDYASYLTLPELFYKLLYYNNFKNEYQFMEMLCLYNFLSSRHRDSKLNNDFKDKLNYFGFSEDNIKDEITLNNLEKVDDGNNKEYLLYSTLNPIFRFLFNGESCESEFKGFPLDVLKSYAKLLDKDI